MISLEDEDGFALRDAEEGRQIEGRAVTSARPS